MQMSQDELSLDNQAVSDDGRYDSPFKRKQCLRRVPSELDDSLHITLERMKKSPSRRGGRRKDVVKIKAREEHMKETCAVPHGQASASDLDQSLDDSERSSHIEFS